MTEKNHIGKQTGGGQGEGTGQRAEPAAKKSKQHDLTALLTSRETTEADQLEEEITLHNRLYWIDNRPVISDEAFDRLVERLHKIRPHSPVLEQIGAGPVVAPDQDETRTGTQERDQKQDQTQDEEEDRDGETAPQETGEWSHRRPMLSLDKCYDQSGLFRWLDRLGKGGGVIVTPKIDGVACSIIYDEQGALTVAATRGDGTKGEVITAQAKTVAGIPHQVSMGNLEVRGEVYMPLAVFADFSDRYANPRNLAAGGLKQKNPERTREYRLSFMAYSLLPPPAAPGEDSKHPASEHHKLTTLKELGFSVVPHQLITNWDQAPVEGEAKAGEDVFQAAYDQWANRRDQLEYEIDGVVFKADDLGKQEEMGYTAHHPRYAIAWKVATESGLTPLLDVLWSVSRTGTVTPVAITGPVELSGATITRATLHNTTIFRDLGLTKGCILRIVRRGGVIPYVEAVEEQGQEPFEPPANCPSCDTPLLEEGDFLRCPNTKGCPEQVMGRAEHYLKTIDVDGFGQAILEQLFKEGLVKDIPDLYQLKVEDLLPLDRMGEVSAAKLVNAINGKKELELSVFLQSLGIENLGPHVAGILQREYGDLDTLRTQTSEDLSSHFGIGLVTANQVLKGLALNEELIKALLEEVTILSPDPLEGEGDDPNRPLKGKAFVFTGRLTGMTRGQARQLVQQAGGSVPSSVVKNLDYLVVGGDGPVEEAREGNKLNRARKYNEEGASIAIINEPKFMELLKPREQPTTPTSESELPQP